MFSPQDSPHSCTVHACIISNVSQNNHGMGHLQPMGEQWSKYNLTSSLKLDAELFYQQFFKQKISSLHMEKAKRQEAILQFGESILHPVIIKIRIAIKEFTPFIRL